MAQRPIGDRVRDVIHLKVPPGCESGVYHILVGNLPFEATWQMFKDHLRPVAEIDHVELFMSSTTGWVRVLGEDNFKRVLHFLDTVPFKDRAIMADGRNATNTIHIRHLVKVDGLSKKHKSQISPHQRAIQAYPKQMPLPPPVVGGPFYGGGQDAGYYMPTGSECESMSSMGYDDAMGGDPFAWSMPTPMYDPSGFAESSTNSFPPFNAFQYTPGSYTFPYTPPSSVDQLSGYEDSGNAGNLAGPVDSRKIIIKEIAYRAREEQIRTMVRDVAGAVRDEIETVTVPKYKNGSLKLIAYVLFCTPEAAVAGLMRFHGHDFMGRKLVAHMYVQRESGPSENGHAEPAVARSKGKGKDKEKEKDRDRKSNGKSYK